MQDDDTDKQPKTRKSIGRKVAWRLALVGVGAIVIAFIGISSREREEGDLARLTQQEAIPTVEVVTPSAAQADNISSCRAKCRPGTARRSTRASAAM